MAMSFTLSNKDHVFLAALIARMSYGDTLYGTPDYKICLEDLLAVCVKTERVIRALIPFYKSNGDLGGVILETNKEVFISPHGTQPYSVSETRKNLQTRVACVLLGKSEVHYHSGYLAHFESIRASVTHCLTLVSALKPIICVGHSLGGAVAGILALDLLSNYSIKGDVRDVFLISLESPRYEYPDAAALSVELLGTRRLRIVQERDWIVTSLVAQGSSANRSNLAEIIASNLGYVHCGATVRLPGTDGMHKIKHVVSEIKHVAIDFFYIPLPCEYTIALIAQNNTISVFVPPSSVTPNINNQDNAEDSIPPYVLPLTVRNSSYNCLKYLCISADSLD